MKILKWKEHDNHKMKLYTFSPKNKTTLALFIKNNT